MHGARPRPLDRGARARQLLHGARSMLPMMAGVVPLALAVGATAASSPMGAFAGWSTSWVIFSGTPQLMTLQMAGQGAPAAAIVLTVLLLNLRLTVYSAALASGWRTASTAWRALASYLLTDPCYVVGEREQRAGLPEVVHRDRYLGAGLTLWVGWLTACGAGVVLGDRVAELMPAELVLDLVLIGMIVPLATGSMQRRLVIAATVTGMVAAGLPLGTGTILSAVLATTFAFATERARCTVRAGSVR